MKDKDLIKISFTGDIMCEMPLLNASHIKGDEYNFDMVFECIRPLIKESDFVVGNLETICAGKEFGYTNHIYSFNTPEQFLKSIKDSGIDLVSTATNHALDRGVEGLKKNLINLRKYNLDSIGTYITPEEREITYIKNFDNLKIAFLNYTYGTNTHINGEILHEDEKFHIGMLKSQEDELKKLQLKQNPKSLKGKIAKQFFKYVSLENWFKIKKKIKKEYNKAYQDNDLTYIDSEYLKQIKKDINKAKEETDFVVVCMHSGGQFHPEPGEFSKFMMNFMSESGVDLVVGNHPHVVQKHEVFETGMFGAYSLGNFSISPSSVYVIFDDLPEYSIMLHVYIDKEIKEIRKITFSILKIIEDKNCNLKVCSIHDLLEKIKLDESNKLINDATRIYNQFMNASEPNIAIKKEYLLYK